jgi:hypothetical protein
MCVPPYIHCDALYSLRCLILYSMYFWFPQLCRFMNTSSNMNWKTVSAHTIQTAGTLLFTFPRGEGLPVSRGQCIFLVRNFKWVDSDIFIWNWVKIKSILQIYQFHLKHKSKSKYNPPKLGVTGRNYNYILVECRCSLNQSFDLSTCCKLPRNRLLPQIYYLLQC